MALQPQDLTLAGDFPAATIEQWRALLAVALGTAGASDTSGTSGTADTSEASGTADALLRTTTYDGFGIDPLYPPASAPAEGRPIGGRQWWLLQHVGESDPAAANEAILTDLTGGASGIWLSLGADGADGLERALEGVYLDLAPIVLDAGADYEAAAAQLLALATGRELLGNLGADPLGLQARTGEPMPLAPAARLAATAAADQPQLRSIVADALPYHEAGGSDGQELGAALAAGVEYLRALTDAGLPAEKAAATIDFRFAATADQFLTIAKLRAARRLWARVGAVIEAPWSIRLHAVTSPAMLTQRDPWVNLLRSTVACFAASAGGADAVTVLPFDGAIGRPDALARRLARNTAALLRDEAQIGRVLDPAGGSGYVESLTDTVARTAWAWFQEIEGAGGLAAALRSGLVADRLAATQQQRARNIATRADPITGVSEFPFLNETPVRRAPRPAGPTGGLPRLRYAEPFEALRDRCDAATTRPTVFLATLGPVAAHSQRATFATNLWGAGGVDTINPGQLDDVAAAFRASGTTIACICPPPTMSTVDIQGVAAALSAAGATQIWLADDDAAAAESTMDNIDGRIFTGCDAIAVITQTLAGS